MCVCVCVCCTVDWRNQFAGDRANHSTEAGGLRLATQLLLIHTSSAGRRVAFKSRPHLQQCRSNVRLCSIRQCWLDIVAGVDGVLHVSSLRGGPKNIHKRVVVPVVFRVIERGLVRYRLHVSGTAPCWPSNPHSCFIIPAKAREYVLPALVCLSVCVFLSVTTITKTIVVGFVPKFYGKVPRGKGRPSSCFVTIGRGMWK